MEVESNAWSFGNEFEQRMRCIQRFAAKAV